MQIDFQERLFIFTEEELTDSARSVNSRNSLFSVMVSPEDAEKQRLFMLGGHADILRVQCSKQERKYCVTKDLLYELYEEEHKALNQFHGALKSRKKGYTGAPYIRGYIAGTVLALLPKLHCGSLENAYKVYLSAPCRYGEEPITPSVSTLKKIWHEFKHVSHLWAALHVHSEMYGIKLFETGPFKLNQPIDPNLAAHLTNFLRIAAYFRNQLIESVNPSTQQPHINDPFMVWNIVMENHRPIPAMKLSPKKI